MALLVCFIEISAFLSKKPNNSPASLGHAFGALLCNWRCGHSLCGGLIVGEGRACVVCDFLRPFVFRRFTLVLLHVLGTHAPFAGTSFALLLSLQPCRSLGRPLLSLRLCSPVPLLRGNNGSDLRLRLLAGSLAHRTLLMLTFGMGRAKS